MSVHESTINPDLADLDLSKVAALQQKRTLAFVNHFVISTVQYLNSFMKQCEQKLMKFERKLEKIEAAMVLLEAKLSSIPGMNQDQTKQDVTDSNTTDQKTNEDPNPAPTPNIEEESNIENESDSNHKTSIQPEYQRFVKMVQVGVPLPAVKLKVSLEGLDPGVLESILGK